MLFERLRRNVLPTMRKIYLLPFNRELARGTLPPEKFQFYLAQDRLFLDDYSKIAAIMAKKLPKNDQTQAFWKLTEDALQAEYTLRVASSEQHRPERRMAVAQPVQIETHPFPLLTAHSDSAIPYAKILETEAYSQFLLNKALTAPVEESFAALLACSWTYHVVWWKIASARVKHNPYQRYIDLYTGPQQCKATAKAIDLLNTLGNEATPETQRKMCNTFRQATQFEYCFFKATLCRAPKGAPQHASTSSEKTKPPAPSVC